MLALNELLGSSHYEMKMLSQDITQEKFHIVYNHLKELERYYPNFKQWYYNTVGQSLTINTRKIIIEQRDGDIAGIAIIKNDINERKICTVKVMPPFLNRGIGIKLFERSMDYLGTRKPLLSVDEDRLPFFKKIFDKYEFRQTQILQDYYRIGKKEFVFNGYII